MLKLPVLHDSGKGVIIAVNKWDAVEDKDALYNEQGYRRNKGYPLFMPYAEILYISALTGQRLNKLFDLVETVIQNQNLRIQTGTLNQVLSDATS